MVKERMKPFKIELPEEQMTPEEIERRRKLVAKTLKLREEIGPIRFSIADVIRSMREGETPADGD